MPSTHKLKDKWIFMNVIPKTETIKENIDKLDFIKIKNFCASKDTIKRMKRQPTGEYIYKAY